MARGPDGRSCACPRRRARAADRPAGRPARARSPERLSADSAQASGVPAASRAACSRATRSCGRNGVSAATLTTQAISGRFAAAQSSAARMPASGPAKSGTLSATTARPVVGKARRIAVRVEDQPRRIAAPRRAITRSQDRAPPMRRSGLSPPPMRRASPPARSTPRVGGVMSPCARDLRSLLIPAALRRCLALSSST